MPIAATLGSVSNRTEGRKPSAGDWDGRSFESQDDEEANAIPAPGKFLVNLFFAESRNPNF
jgi:hypothetical protein